MPAPDPGSAPSRAPRPDRLEQLVLLHVGAMVVFTSWAFGGQAPWVRTVLAWGGTVGIGLFLAAVVRRWRQGGPRSPALRYLLPLWGYDLLVGVSCLNPGFREALVGGEPSLVMINPVPWLPSAALPRLALQELWQFNGIVLSTCNLLLAVQSRRRLRGLLLVLAGNAVVLAVLGTFQKLGQADGLWFGLVPSPQPRFFSTFVYHNHWGAFTVLNTAVCLGLLLHYARRGDGRSLGQSPVLTGAVAVFLLAASVPLSASRSSTVLIGLLLAGAFVHVLVQVIRRRRRAGRPAALPAAAIVVTAAAALAAAAYLGQDVIAQRARLTSAQLAEIAREDTLNSRLALYRDTWRMAAARPWFGWGLESYARVFRIFNTQRAAELWIWIPYYAEAHNDWLQSLAEVGFVGTGLLALLVLWPVAAVRWRRVGSVVPRYLLAGGGLVLLYAWVEFPFANPAVMLTFCATFYGALRYAALESRAAPDAS
ncbi:MAG: O-antigen ligase family protein [Opitutaceae bacterium]|nr:O-antigen ligase family protein [Opitutaceae bacterium]